MALFEITGSLLKEFSSITNQLENQFLRPLITAGLPLMKSVLTPLGKSILLPFGNQNKLMSKKHKKVV